MPIVGATNDQILLAHAQFSEAGRYSVVVSNAENSVTSADAVLTVNSPRGGDLDYSFAWGGSVNGRVLSVAVQPDGRILIAGEFTMVHGAVRGRIARLNADGTIDHTFMNGLSGANANVLSVAVQADGKVLIGGHFTNVNGVSRTRIARLNADGTLDSAFQTHVGLAFQTDGEGEVRSVAVQADGRILIAGIFGAVNGRGRNSIARLNADGTLDNAFQNIPSASEISGYVYTVAVQADGKIVIGGNFHLIPFSLTGNNVARLNADGTLDTNFLSGLSGANQSVHSLVAQADGKVVIGGFFSMDNGVGPNSIARLNPDGTLDRDFQTTLPAGTAVFSVAAQRDGKVLIAGSFSSVSGVSRKDIARLNADGTLDASFVPVAGSSPIAIQSDGKVLTRGDYTFANVVSPGSSPYTIVRLNADGTLDHSFQNRVTGADGYVFSVAAQRDRKVLIGGAFSRVHGVKRDGIARLHADGTLDTSFVPAAGSVPIATQADGKVLAGTARLNDDGSLDTSFRVIVNLGVNSVAVQSDGKVLIGGNFTVVNGVDRANVARLNADGTLDSSFLNGLSGVAKPGSLFGSTVNSVAVQSDSKVLIGGYFTTVNGVSRTNIARLNADGTLDTSFVPAAGYAPIAIQSDGKILASNVRLNADGTLDTGFQSGSLQRGLFGQPASVWSLAVQSDGKVLYGGDFNFVNGVSRNGIARLYADGTLDGSFQNALGGVAESGDLFPPTVINVAVQSDGKVLIGGDFTIVNGVPALYFARLWAARTFCLRSKPSVGAEQM